MSETPPLAPLQLCCRRLNVFSTSLPCKHIPHQCSLSITRAIAEVLKTGRFNLCDTIHRSGITIHPSERPSSASSHIPRPRRHSLRRLFVSLLDSQLEVHSTPGAKFRRSPETPLRIDMRGCTGGSAWLVGFSATDRAGSWFCCCC